MVVRSRIPLAIELAQLMSDDRALYVAELRVLRGNTWRMIAEDCGRVWRKAWTDRQDIGEALCGLASAYLWEDWRYLDELPDPPT